VKQKNYKALKIEIDNKLSEKLGSVFNSKSFLSLVLLKTGCVAGHVLAEAYFGTSFARLIESACAFLPPSSPVISSATFLPSQPCQNKNPTNI
jgi:hypothetical protein